MYLFIDTETTGLPKSPNASPLNVDDYPRIIQFAWAYYSKNGKLLKKDSSLIKPDGWIVPNKKFWIDNGLTTERCERLGLPIKDVLDNFLIQLNKTSYLVAHNVPFDVPVLQAEMIRLGLKSTKKPDKICTMYSTIGICGIEHPQGGYKYPSLKELHNHLFQCDFDGAHDAMGDVMATAKCFFELKKQRIIH